MEITMGSLFDGIGGFPLGGQRHGITPIWASEIEKFPLRVTALHFPQMQQLGDITKLRGKDLPPVDILTGGSPCQDLSIAAGKRAGLAGARSGLFFEQVRIMREMRDADAKRAERTTQSIRPRFLLWENVPGCLSSAHGRDYQTILQEICSIAIHPVSIPEPPKNKWRNAGAILGDTFSLAWVLQDAQYRGVPQRRRRIYLVCDFGGHAAPAILFEQSCLRGDTAPSRAAGQGAAADSPSGIGDTGGDIAAVAFPRSETMFTAEFSARQGAKAGGIGWQEECAPTLKSSSIGSNITPSILCANDQSLLKEIYCIAGNTVDRQPQNGGNGIGIQKNIAYTVTAADKHVVYEPYQRVVGTLCLGDHKGVSSQYVSQNKCIVEGRNLIRRLTPLENERLMGYPDGWTDLPGASDSARYRALGNSVAIPCVEYVMRGIVLAMEPQSKNQKEAWNEEEKKEF